jgi:hypothetical protein
MIEIQDVIRASWRAARQEMLKAINRISYRSMLTLYLFAQTPVPVGLSEHEELDGISGLVCIQTALCQLQQLRALNASCQFDAPASGTSFDSARSMSQYVDYENRAYWAAMIWDTSSSLTLEYRTSLTSGLKGACSEPTWRLVKAFLVGSFVPRTEQWHREGFEPTGEVANEIVSAASICKTYIWKNITSLKEAIREGVQDDGVLFAWKALLEAFDIFNTSIRPLLKSCEMRLQCFAPSLRLKLFNVNLQYCLGVLLLIQSLENAARSDLLQELRLQKHDAECESFSVLKLGLENKYMTNEPVEAQSNNGLPRLSTTITLVAIYPNPQYVVECVIRIHKGLQSRLGQNDTTVDNYSDPVSILLRALSQLPQSSKSVQEALAQVTTCENTPTVSL